MPESIINFYGAPWCSDCRRAHKLITQNNVPHKYINIDFDRKGEEYVIMINHGLRRIPTIIFPDGSILVEPSNDQLAQKLGIEIHK